MKLYKLSFLFMTVTLFLTACGGSDSSSTSAVAEEIEKIIAQTGQSDAVALADKIQLIADIEAKFGHAQAEPKNVNDGETVEQLFARLGN